MICKACNHIRDVDLCRDSHLLVDENQLYVYYSKDCVEIVFVFKLIVIGDKTVIVVLEL